MARPGNSSIISVYGLGLAVTGVAMLALIAPAFAEETSVALAMRTTAKLAFFVYIAIFLARPLKDLVPNSFTRSLVSYRPYLGLIFAAIMTVHLALIAWWFIFITRQSPPVMTLIVGGIAYALVFLMLITTFEAPARALGPANWRRLHKTGLYWVGAVFANSLLPDAIANPTDPVYLASATLIAAAIAVRVTAYVMRRRQKTAAIESAR